MCDPPSTNNQLSPDIPTYDFPHYPLSPEKDH